MNTDLGMEYEGTKTGIWSDERFPITIISSPIRVIRVIRGQSLL